MQSKENSMSFVGLCTLILGVVLVIMAIHDRPALLLGKVFGLSAIWIVIGFFAGCLPFPHGRIRFVYMLVGAAAAFVFGELGMGLSLLISGRPNLIDRGLSPVIAMGGSLIALAATSWLRDSTKDPRKERQAAYIDVAVAESRKRQGHRLSTDLEVTGSSVRS